MSAEVARFRAQWNALAEQIRQRPQLGGRYPSQRWAETGSAVIAAGCNARNVRAIKADIGQFAIAKLGQFADIALVVPESLDHADEREQHGNLLVSTIQPLEAGRIVEMNIERNVALQKLLCCDAANRKTHGIGKK
jgi:hypothetical protein